MQNLEYKILEYQNPELNILEGYASHDPTSSTSFKPYRVHIKEGQNPEFNILRGQNPEFNILEGQNPEFKILALVQPKWGINIYIELGQHKFDQIAARKIRISLDNRTAFSNWSKATTSPNKNVRGQLNMISVFDFWFLNCGFQLSGIAICEF